MEGLRVPPPIRRAPPAKRQPAAFTLVEMLVATIILLIIMAVLLAMTEQTGRVWRSTVGRMEVFKSSRAAFDALTRTLSQATLNTYYDYGYVSGGTLQFTQLASAMQAAGAAPGPTPSTYGRNSDLQIVSGLTTTNPPTTLLPSIGTYTAVTHSVFFQAPLGYNTVSGYTSLDSLVNTCGFYVAYGPDPARPGFLLPANRYRYRLMQFLQSSNNLGIYQSDASTTPPTPYKGTNKWYWPLVQTDLAATTQVSDFVMTENVIALVLLPKLSLKDEVAAENAYGGTGVIGPVGTAIAPSYAYDSSTVGPGGSLNPSGISAYPLLNTLNQLPPVMQVTMVAIDEVSAQRIAAQNSTHQTTPPNTALGLTANIFTQSKNFQTDLASLEVALVAAHVNFRVFQTDVALRDSKWTSHN